jgi:glucan 1,3-beta-glucosidase
MRLVAFVVALVACVHLGLWVLLRDRSDAPNFEGQLASVSYAPYRGTADPDTAPPVTAAEIRSDLKLLAPYVRAVRTYSSTNGGELVPAIANEFGLRTTIGAWIEKDVADDKEVVDPKVLKRNEREIRAVIELARVTAISMPSWSAAKPFTAPIRRSKTSSRRSSASAQRAGRNAGHDWRNLERVDRPSGLVSVDFAAAYPAWHLEQSRREGRGRRHIEVCNKLRAAYPGKRVVIAEFGQCGLQPRRRGP